MPSTGPVMTLRVYQTNTVLDVEDEVIRVRSTIDSTAAKMAMAIPGMDGMPDFSGGVTTEMDTRGRSLGVISTEGLPEIPGLNPESIMQESSNYVLPETEVSPGDSWTLEAPMALPMGPAGSMSIDVAMTYTFVSLEGSLATLSFEGPIDMQPQGAGE